MLLVVLIGGYTLVGGLGVRDLDIFEFENHFCCLGHLLCLLLQLHGHLQPDRRVYGGIRRKYCPC